MTATLVIIVPVLDRPQNIDPLVESVAATTPVPWHLMFVSTIGHPEETEAINAAMSRHAPWPEEDDEPWPAAGVITSLAQHPNHFGDYARKINQAVRATDEPYLFFGADDIRFQPGWFDAALSLMTAEVGVVGTNDLGPWRPNSPSRNAVRDGEHSTHCLVARWYTHLGLIDDPTQVWNEDYWHELGDDEFTATARHRGAWSYARDSHVRHLHPHLTPEAVTDASYQAWQPRLTAGRQVYRARAHLWGEDPPKR